MKEYYRARAHCTCARNPPFFLYALCSCLCRWRTILGPERAKQFLPDIYLFDTTNMVFVMEFLGDCELLVHSMVATGEVPLEVRMVMGYSE